MKSQKIRATSQQVSRLLGDLRATLAEAAGDHLSDDEVAGYAQETLAEDAAERITAHLAACPDCARCMEHLFQVSEAWRGEAGTERLARLRAKASRPSLSDDVAASVASLLTGLHAFFASFSYSLDLLSPLTAQAAAPAAPFELESSDGWWSLFVRRAENGDLVVRFDTPALFLEGEEICLYVGNWQKVMHMRRVAQDYVGGEVVITRADRAALRPGAVLRAKLVGGKSE